MTDPFDFNPRITSGGIEDDIEALSKIGLDDARVNEFVSSLVIKYIQAYFGAIDVGEALNVIEDRVSEIRPSKRVSEIYALECLGSLTQTSAIIKEIIFNDRYQSDGKLRSCDVGSGTGILSLGAYISGLRKGLQQGTMFLMDHEEISLERGREVLQSIVGSSFEVCSILGDIRDTAEIEKLGPEKIQIWISETFGNQTPSFEIDMSQGGLGVDPAGHQGYTISREIDPFPEVLMNIFLHNPDIDDDVREGKVALFPDYINGLYVPNGQESTLDLTTSGQGPVSLGRIGQDFAYLKPFDSNIRWR